MENCWFLIYKTKKLVNLSNKTLITSSKEKYCDRGWFGHSGVAGDYLSNTTCPHFSSFILSFAPPTSNFLLPMSLFVVLPTCFWTSPFIFGSYHPYLYLIAYFMRYRLFSHLITYFWHFTTCINFLLPSFTLYRLFLGLPPSFTCYCQFLPLTT